MKILVVDDDMLIRLNIAEELSDAGHEVLEAVDGRAAIQILLKSDHTFDAVITDMQMPDGNGIDVLQTMLRARKVYPTYVHSAAPTFRYPGGETLTLASHIPSTFSFAHFSMKSGQILDNITAFLNSITNAQLE